jgi:MFS family permease
MSIGMFMAVLDIQIVASSLPGIQGALQIPLDRLGWVQTAYLSAEIVAISLTGWITRASSTRTAFVVCVLGFTASSVACAGISGFLIPLVFSAVFLMFADGSARVRATMIAGIPGAVLDQLLAGADPKTAFDLKGLIDDLKKARPNGFSTPRWIDRHLFIAPRRG